MYDLQLENFHGFGVNETLLVESSIVNLLPPQLRLRQASYAWQRWLRLLDIVIFRADHHAKQVEKI